MFRLHIDIPIPASEEEAIDSSKRIMELFHYMIRSKSFGNFDIEQINYRLGHDEDRQKSNYLDKNDNGHVSNKKSKIVLTRPLTADEAEIK
jgi:hypothetical protein